MLLARCLRHPGRLARSFVSKGVRARHASSSSPLVQPHPLPAWATIDPYTAGRSEGPGQGMNLVSGEWQTTKQSEEIVDPLTGDTMFLVPDTSSEEVPSGVLRAGCSVVLGGHSLFSL